MPENQMAGQPHLGQTVRYYNGTITLPAIVYAVSHLGLPSLSILNGATVTGATNVPYDNTATVANTWSWPSIQSGL
jgi:hypothetical protein